MPLTAAEQFLIEMINRARLDPMGEARRYGLSDLNQGLAPGTISGQPLRVLSPNALLEAAADGHTAWMLEADTFSHTGANGSTPAMRAAAAGYSLTGSYAVGENLAMSGTTGTINLNTAIAGHHQGLFLSAGHRANILSAAYREVGVAQVQGLYAQGGVTFNASMVTEAFGRSGTAVFLTGVVYADTDRNGAYSIGEGQAGTRFQIGSAQTTAAQAGGYGLATAAVAAAVVTVVQGAATSTVVVDLSGGNAKLDVIDGAILATSVDLTLVSGITHARALGVGDIAVTGGAAADALEGNAGANVLSGAAGADTLTGGAGNDTLIGGAGADVLNGGDGVDTASYAGSSMNHVIDLMMANQGTALAAQDSFIGIENLIGSSGHDNLRGSDIANQINGAAGNDTLYGRGGNDTLIGGTGTNVLEGGQGADRLIGGTGRDTASYALATAGVTVNLAVATQNTGDAAGDSFSGIENLWGSQRNDTLTGDGQANRLTGAAGNDLLRGAAGNDALDGGIGADTLEGGQGADRLTGGAGADVFVFDGGQDSLADFRAADGDSVAIHRLLVGNAALTPAQLAGFATIAGADVVLSFAGGHTLTLSGLATTDGLAAHLLLW